MAACSGEVESEVKAENEKETKQENKEQEEADNKKPEEKKEQNDGMDVNKATQLLEEHVLEENDETLLAHVACSSAGDEFLQHEDWEVLTIDFVGFAEVSMHRNEKETDENDFDYFPMDKIIDQFE
ncbi:hypothetical protein [Virgibacillus pantothenticus]|uniref:hypothetical protein n=1 Tax=Virgibacillus pantothenticus TaxID=1473 RepID=UPI0009868FAD|nr:hypothetical protein [Virgibacillus pantothenticus]